MEKELIPISHPQMRLLFIDLLEPENALWNIPRIVRFKKDYSPEIISKAINFFIYETVGIRIRYTKVEDKIFQYIAEYEEREFEIIDFSGSEEREKTNNTKMNEWVKSISRKPIQLFDSDLFSFVLLKLPDGKNGYYLNIHHTIVDGWCMKLMIDRISELAQIFEAGVTPEPNITKSYTDFAGHESNYLKSNRAEEDKNYWLEEFSTLPEPVAVNPFDKMESKANGLKTIFLSKEESEKIFEFTREHHTSAFKLYLAAMYVYLTRISGKNDIAIGIPIANRPEEFKDTFGMFVNYLPFRITSDINGPFSDLIKFVNNKIKKYVDHGNLSYDLIIDALENIHGKFDEMVTISLAQNFETLDNETTSTSVNSYVGPGELCAFISYDYNNPELNPIEFNINYNLDLINDKKAVEIIDTLNRIVFQVIENSEIALSDIDILPVYEKSIILNHFNKPVELPEHDFTYQDLFAKTARMFSDRTAVVFKDDKLTYAELNKKADALASRIIEHGGGPDVPVVILAERSVEIIVAFIAVLKSGSCFVPIDPSYPADRKKYMLDDSAAPILISQRHLYEEIDFNGAVIDLDDRNNYLLVEKIPSESGPDSLAYIIYTSGSTGKPKGVMIENHSLVNMCQWLIEEGKLDENDRCLKTLAFSFDASVIEIFPQLLAGAELHILSEEIRKSIVETEDYIVRNKITTAVMITQFGEQFMEITKNKSMRWLITGGEKLRSYKKTGFDLINGYGPTENTVISTYYYVNEIKKNIPIGYPVKNSPCYIFDKFSNLQPIGVPGELCVGGAQLARGYLNLPEKTDAVFVTNPVTGERMYRTGDLCRWLPDGTIEYLGRIDRQVKVRGYRIELGEIETAIKNIEGIKDAVVVDIQDTRGVYLCAYYIADQEMDAGKIKAAAREVLPDYMIPQYLMRIDSIPLTPVGKVDRKALPEPKVIEESKTEYIEPETETEKIIASIFGKILGIDKIGKNDDFFDLGGHSLKAVVLQARIEKKFSLRISLKNLFDLTTVAKLAEYIDQTDKHEIIELTPAEPANFYPASSAQRQLFVLEQMKNIGTTYNVPCILTLEGNVDLSRLSEAIEKLVERHEALRTSFEVKNGTPVQVVHPKAKIKRLIADCSDNEINDKMLEFIRPFNLQKAPLARFKLLRISKEKVCLLMDFHHIIFDGISLTILMKDLSAFYNAETPEALKLHFKDYVSWEDKIIQSDEIHKQEEFWLKTFADVPTLDLPTDMPRKASVDYEGDIFEIDIMPELTNKINMIAKAQDTTLNVVLMSALYVLMAKYTNQNDIVIGSPTGGRLKEEAEDMIGMFVNTLPVRALPEKDKTFIQLINEVKATLFDVYENQNYPIENIYDKINVNRESGRNPLFDVILVLQNMGGYEFQSEGINSVIKEFNNHSAKFDLSFTFTEQNEMLNLKLYYRTSLFKEETAARMCRHLENIMNEMCLAPEMRIGSMKMIDSHELKALLYEFNHTEAEWPENKTAHEIFEETVRRFPERTAIELGDKSWTYSELNDRANSLAKILRSKGVKADTIVAIFLERSMEMVLSALAIIKAGGAYLPVIPEYPPERIDFMLSDSGTKILLSSSELGKRLDFEGEIIDVYDQALYSEKCENLEPISCPDDMIYIIYTSGSTGKPKGVMLEHHNLVRLLKNSRFQFDFDEHDVWTLFHSFSFDFSVWEMYGPLLFGGKLVVVPKEEAQNPEDFIKLLSDKKVTVLNQTPGAFYNLIETEEHFTEKLLGLRFVIFGGEALKPILLNNFHKRYPETKLINMYGITETTVHVTYKEIGQYEIDNNISNIGLPIPTLTCYIMDTEQHIVPYGVAGELCVGGEGVARGYMNREELTGERFIPNPYRPKERMYRSGDLARRLPSGEMEYLGRIDFQVKIRGFRIELGEIEDKLLKHNEINKVVVLAKEETHGEKYLCAYYVSENEITVNELREFLHKDLPDYMVPSYFIHMDEFPLTSNGKVDRRQLPEPGDKISSGAEFVAPRNKKEEKIANAWMEILGLDKISIKDDFFSLGGHSLKAVALTAKLQKDFDVRVNDIFEYPTIEELAENINESEDNLKIRLEKLREFKFNDVDYRTVPELKTEEEEYQKEVSQLACLDLTVHNGYKHILLTGATGYLGIYLLRDLSRKEGVKITAIVRGDSNDKAMQRLENKLKFYFPNDYIDIQESGVEVICGDIAEDSLGLDNENYSRLCEECDCVWHSAAIVKHYGAYEDFYRANVKATDNILAFAGDGRKKDFHHISTISVALGHVPGNDVVLFSEDKCDIGQEVDNYYVKTKLEAETRVIAAREKGIKTNIYRIGNIVYNSETGVHQQNIDDNAFYNIFRAFINIGAVLKGDYYDFSFVDYVSNAVLTLSGRENLLNSTYHIENPMKVDISDILSGSKLNLNVETFDLKEFIHFLYSNFERDGFRPFIEAIMLHKGWLSEDFDKINATKMDILSDKTAKALELSGFEWKKPDENKMRNMVVNSLQQRIEFLNSLDLFKEMDDEAISSLAGIAMERYYDPDEEVVWENDMNRDVYLIREGAVEQMRHSVMGWLGTINVIGTGEIFGEGAVWDDKSSVTAQPVISSARIMKLPKDKLKTLLTKHPDLALRLSHYLHDQTDKLKKMIVEI